MATAEANNPREKLRICLVGQKIQVQSRSTDTGLLWPLARGLSKRGHDVTIISSSSPLKKNEIYRDGIRAFYLFEGQSQYKTLQFDDAVHKKFTALHNDRPFDIVHCLDQGGFKIGRHKKNFKTCVAYDVQATSMSSIFSTLAENDGSLSSQFKTLIKLIYRFANSYFMHDRSLLDTADGLFVTTPQQRSILERYFLFPDYHTYTVPYGINLGDLTPRAESGNFKLKFQIPEDAQIILAVSDFTNASELRPLLKAFEHIIMKDSNVYLFLVGDGPRWKSVEHDMLKLVLGSRVIMTGSLAAEDLIECILASSIYVDLSSRSTGLEPSMIEAMAQKKIVIGSELSPIAEIIEDGHDGYLVRPADDNSISKLLERILHSEESYSIIGEAAREKVIKFFNRDKMIDTLLSAYYQIIEKSPYFKHRKK
ncbi:MAG: glycosyltransferase family 4 protein [Pseudobdellovibrio sp.]